MSDLEQALLALVHRETYRPVKPRAIAKQLKLPDEELRGLKLLIKKLVKSGKLSYGSNHLVGPPVAPKKPKLDEITGVFRRLEQGFGFVRPTGVDRAAGRDHDIYIAQDDARDAASGDTVLVRLSRKAGRFGTRQGVIIEVLERETHHFVGTYFEAGGAAYVQVDGSLFAQPVWVGDPGAKNAQPDDKVVFEMVRFPSHTHDGEGVITEVLGPRGSPGVDTLSIIREYNLPGEFPEDVLDDARARAEQFDEADLTGRTDFTGATTITIDPVDARDFDDAISLEKTDQGHWRLGVHIADVSHFVTSGTPLDREGHQRANSTYLPDRVIPMLPEIISNSLASLQPDRVRYTMTAVLEFTAEAVRVDTELHVGAIRSDRRFTYEEVDEYLADREAWKAKLTPEVHALLARMHELAMLLRARRLARGALELTMPEVKVDLDKQGRVCGAHRVVNTESHQIIEEFMLAANEAVADALAAADIAFLRRVHLPPDPRKLKALTEFVASLGLSVDSLESRFAMQELLAEVKDRPEQHAVNYALLRSLQQAVYSPQPEGHYALASKCYCHFTSPIRRYPDLTIHRLVRALIGKKKPASDMTDLVTLGEHCSDRERRSEAAERELTKVKLLDYMSTRIGTELDVIITGVERFGMFAQGTELPAEGLVHITSLSDDYYTYDRTTHSLVGRRAGNSFRLGDKLRVTVAHVDLDRRELDFRIVERRGRAEPPQTSSQRPGGKKPKGKRHRAGEAVATKRPKTGGKARNRLKGGKKGRKGRHG